jgi:hypothetical protein
MVILPRIARALNAPAIAGLLAVVLIGVGIFGLASADIGPAWAITVLVVGIINLIRAIPAGADAETG